MKITRNILGEKPGSIFGTIEIVLSDKELEEAYKEYIRLNEEEEAEK